MATYGQNTLHLSARLSLAGEFANNAISVVAILVGAAVSDRKGRKHVMLVPQLLFCALIVPCFLWLTTARDAVSFIGANLILVVRLGLHVRRGLRGDQREHPQAGPRAGVRADLRDAGGDARRIDPAGRHLAARSHGKPDVDRLVPDRRLADRFRRDVRAEGKRAGQARAGSPPPLSNSAPVQPRKAFVESLTFRARAC